MKELAKKENIALYSAKMVLKGKWTLDYALSLERPVFNTGVRWLLNAKKKKWLMAFKTFDRGTIAGKILKVRKFNNLILVRGKLKYPEKIDNAYIYNAKDQRLLPEYIRHDPFVTDIKEKPAYKPSDRKAVDLSVIKERTPVRVTLYTGEILEGVVSWTTDFDFELKMDRYLSVLVLNHAVHDAVEKEYHRFRQPLRKKQPPRRNFQQSKGPARNNYQRPKPPNSGFGPMGGFGPSSGNNA